MGFRFLSFLGALNFIFYKALLGVPYLRYTDYTMLEIQLWH